MPVAGKTGTTEYYDNLWFAGYTPYYTCTIWSGYDNNERLPDQYMYRNYHKILWKNIMSRIHEDLEYQEFPISDSVEKTTVCSVTGKLPSGGCPTITEYFEKATLPSGYCDGNHSGVAVPSTADESNDTTTPTPTPTETPTPTPDSSESENSAPEGTDEDSEAPSDSTSADTPGMGDDGTGTEDGGEDTGTEDTDTGGTEGDDSVTDEDAEAPI